MSRLDRFITRSWPVIAVVALVIVNARIDAIADGRITHAGQAGTLNGTPPRYDAPLTSAAVSLPSGQSAGAGCRHLTPAGNPLPPSSQTLAVGRSTRATMPTRTTRRCVETELDPSPVGGAKLGSTGALRAAGEPGIVIAKPPTDPPGQPIARAGSTLAVTP